jgi:hypothetical protein
MKVAGILHFINLHGGVRRYFEIGNALIRQGHEFTLFSDTNVERCPWMEFNGKWLPRRQFKGMDEFDIAFTGANECYGDLIEIKAKTKVILIVAKFYAHDCVSFYKQIGDRMLWVGVSTNWNKGGMEEINGVTCVGGVNTHFFKPLPNKQTEKLKVIFYGRNDDPVRRGTAKIVELTERLKNRHDFIAYDAKGYATISGNYIKVNVCNSQQDLLNTLQQGDVILSGMANAGWNNVCAEGMACGCVPIATPAGTEDLIINGDNGYVCNDEDWIPQMIKYLDELDRDRAKLKLMQRKALAWVQQYSWDIFVMKLLKEVKKYESSNK